MERRKAIEAEVGELVKGMVTRMMEVEEALLLGYGGRLRELRSVLG